MNKNIFKSVGAFVAGLVVIFVLSYGTDAVLEAIGILSGRSLPMYGSVLLIIAILAYRLIYSMIGCYVAARLAPNYPMRHALALGIFGFVGSVAGAIAGRNLAPAWYSWTLVVLALPCAWIGGRIYELSSTGADQTSSLKKNDAQKITAKEV